MIKNHADVNAESTWKKLKKKYEPISVASMVKLDHLFGESS
jgi:hypothetical protein